MRWGSNGGASLHGKPKGTIPEKGYSSTDPPLLWGPADAHIGTQRSRQEGNKPITKRFSPPAREVTCTMSVLRKEAERVCPSMMQCLDLFCIQGPKYLQLIEQPTYTFEHTELGNAQVTVVVPLKPQSTCVASNQSLTMRRAGELELPKQLGRAKIGNLGIPQLTYGNKLRKRQKLKAPKLSPSPRSVHAQVTLIHGQRRGCLRPAHQGRQGSHPTHPLQQLLPAPTLSKTCLSKQ